MSRLTRDVQVDVLGRRITARELDVSEVRAHLAGAGAAAAEVDAVGVLLFDGISFADLTAMSDVTLDELGRLAPSEIKDIISACREVNADFFAMMARLAKLG